MKLPESGSPTAPALSPPGRGAWIEIVVEIAGIWARIVAPRAGGVD